MYKVTKNIKASDNNSSYIEILEKDFKVPRGIYIYKVGEKKVTINWKGGSLSDFSEAINKRSNGVIKSMIIGSSQGKKSILIEAVATGKENKLIFEEDAKTFALDSNMISPVQKNAETFGDSINQLASITNYTEENAQKRMPTLSLEKVSNLDVLITIKISIFFSFSMLLIMSKISSPLAP